MSQVNKTAHGVSTVETNWITDAYPFGHKVTIPDPKDSSSQFFLETRVSGYLTIGASDRVSGIQVSSLRGAPVGIDGSQLKSDGEGLK